MNAVLYIAARRLRGFDEERFYLYPVERASAGVCTPPAASEV